MRLLLILLFCVALRASAATLNVTNAPYNLVGDCTNVWVSVSSNSTEVVTTNVFTAGDVGKVVQLFGAGYYALLGNGGLGGTGPTNYFQGSYSYTPTNHQDLVAVIVSVGDGTHLQLDRACGVTASNIRMTVGTDNRSALTNTIHLAAASDTLYFPPGNYQVVEPNALDTNYTMSSIQAAGAAVNLFKSSLTFLGAGTNESIITGVGAWQQRGLDTAYRGSLFRIQEAPTNNGALVFENLQLDGNATRNHATNYTFWPAVPTDGSGWDMSHHLFTTIVSGTDIEILRFTNCLIRRWHGETVQGISSGTGFSDITSCVFDDGNATVINFSSRHNFRSNIVRDYYQVAEDGQFTAGSGTNLITDNIFTNIHGGSAYVLNGASTTVAAPAYFMARNKFYGPTNGYALHTAGIKNVEFSSNQLYQASIFIGASGRQNDMWNSNLVVSHTEFIGALNTALLIGGSYSNRADSVIVRSNNAPALTGNFAAISGYVTNTGFYGNTANKGLALYFPTAANEGQWFYDDVSNDFPPKTYSDAVGITNTVNYYDGARHAISSAVATSKLVLNDATPLKIPTGARVFLTNADADTVTLYLTSNYTRSTNLVTGTAYTFAWNGYEWNDGTPASVWNISNLTIGAPVAVTDPPGIYVDASTGSDSNAGTSSEPFATLAKVTATPLANGTNIYIRPGHYRGELLITNHNITVTGYGGRPLLDCSDLITNAWIQTAGQTNLYQSTNIWSGGTAWLAVWENSNQLVRATSINNCDTNPGSYYPSSDSASPVTIFVHASDSANPAGNGKVYEYSARSAGVYGNVYNGTTNTTVRGLHTRRNAGNDGSIVVNGTIDDCWASEGGKHNVLIFPGGQVLNTITTNFYYPAGAAIPIVAYMPTGAGENTLISNCIVSNPTFVESAVGIYQHPSAGYFGRIRILDCYINNVGTGLSPLSRELEVVNTIITNTLTGISSANFGLFLTNVAVYADKETAGSPTDVAVSLAGTGDGSTNFIVNCTIGQAGTDYALRAASAVASVYINGSTFAGTYALNATSTNPTFSATTNTFLGTAWFIQSTNQVVLADWNSYAGSQFIAADATPSTMNFTQWKAATGQDANSTNP